MSSKQKEGNLSSKASSPSKVAGAAKPDEEVEPSVLELLEEDDEFEEFDDGTWNKADEVPEEKLWQDDWDDQEDQDDDFIVQLREHIKSKQT